MEYMSFRTAPRPRMYGKTKTQSTLIEVEDVKIKNVESSASEFRQKYQTRSDDNGDVAMPSHKQMLDVLCMVFDKGRHTKRHMISLSLSSLLLPPPHSLSDDPSLSPRFFPMHDTISEYEGEAASMSAQSHIHVNTHACMDTNANTEI